MRLTPSPTKTPGTFTGEAITYEEMRNSLGGSPLAALHADPSSPAVGRSLGSPTKAAVQAATLGSMEEGGAAAAGLVRKLVTAREPPPPERTSSPFFLRSIATSVEGHTSNSMCNLSSSEAGAATPAVAAAVADVGAGAAGIRPRDSRERASGAGAVSMRISLGVSAAARSGSNLRSSDTGAAVRASDDCGAAVVPLHAAAGPAAVKAAAKSSPVLPASAASPPPAALPQPYALPASPRAGQQQSAKPPPAAVAAQRRSLAGAPPRGPARQLVLSASDSFPGPEAVVDEELDVLQVCVQFTRGR